MNSYNDFMNNEYTKHKYESYEDKPKLNKALIPKDTSELTKAFFNKRNEQQQADRDNQLDCDAYYAHQSPRQFKNGR